MSRRPVQLLVSVRSAAEAIAALAGGADIIDVKEPSRGSLGRADREVIREVVAAVAGRAPVSVALGEAALQPYPPGRGDRSVPGVSYAKLGLAGAPPHWRALLTERLAALRGVPFIAAAYVDADRAGAPPIRDVLAWAIHARAAGLLIDTFGKDGRGLFDWVSSADLRSILSAAGDADLPVALAGSLRGASFEKALESGPDILAVRGAACAGNDRNAAVDAARVRRLADLIAARNARPVSSAG